MDVRLVRLFGKWPTDSSGAPNVLPALLRRSPLWISRSGQQKGPTPVGGWASGALGPAHGCFSVERGVRRLARGQMTLPTWALDYPPEEASWACPTMACRQSYWLAGAEKNAPWTVCRALDHRLSAGHLITDKGLLFGNPKMLCSTGGQIGNSQLSTTEAGVLCRLSLPVEPPALSSLPPPLGGFEELRAGHCQEMGLLSELHRVHRETVSSYTATSRAFIERDSYTATQPLPSQHRDLRVNQ